MNDDDNVFHKYYAPLSFSNNQEDLSTGIEYKSTKSRVIFIKILFFLFY